MQPSKITTSFGQNATAENGDAQAIQLTATLDEFLSSSAILLENLPVALCVVDNQMNVRFVNKTLRHLAGIKHLSTVTAETNFRDLFARNRRALFAVEPCVAVGNAVTLRRNMIFGDTVKHGPYLIQIQPAINNETADIHGALISFREDMEEYQKHFTEEKQALVDRIKILSKDVLEKQSLIRALLDKSPFGIVLLNIDRKVMQINNSASQILGINKRDAIGLSCENIFKCHAPADNCPLIANGHLFDRKETLSAYGGCADKTLLRSVMSSNDGEHEVILEAFVDITEIKEAAKAKETAYQAKNDFFLKMSHELRTPLNAIIGYSDLIVEDFDIIQREEMLETIGAIQRSGYDLLHMVDQVLDTSKIEAGHVRQEYSAKSINLMLHETELTLRPLVEKGNNKLDIQCRDGIDVLYTEHEHLKRILLNLLSNAAKYTEQGLISLQVHREILDDKPWICFDVSDTGIGLNAEQLQRVFERFEQADNSTTRRFSGSGLGLTIANELCIQMGGHITARSEPNAGSTFSVWIPEIQKH